MNIVSEHGFRRDGRKPDQIRNINYKLGVYSQADGSSYLEQGSTKVGLTTFPLLSFTVFSVN